MVGHYYPGVQAVSLLVEMKQAVFHESSDLGNPQDTFAMSAIEFDLCALANCRIGNVARQFAQLPVPLVEQALGQGVGKAKGNKLRDLLTVKVRQITTRVPG